MKYVKPELNKYDELKQVTFSHQPEHHPDHHAWLPFLSEHRGWLPFPDQKA